MLSSENLHPESGAKNQFSWRTIRTWWDSQYERVILSLAPVNGPTLLKGRREYGTGNPTFFDHFLESLAPASLGAGIAKRNGTDLVSTLRGENEAFLRRQALEEAWVLRLEHPDCPNQAELCPDHNRYVLEVDQLNRV